MADVTQLLAGALQCTAGYLNYSLVGVRCGIVCVWRLGRIFGGHYSTVGRPTFLVGVTQLLADVAYLLVNATQMLVGGLIFGKLHQLFATAA